MYATNVSSMKSMNNGRNEQLKKMNPKNPPRPFHSAADRDGFAWPTVSRRWPVIITQAIDDLARHGHANNRSCASIVATLASLKYEIEHGKPIPPLVQTSGDCADVDVWNKALELYFPDCSFYSASWLFGECLLYRRIHAAIESVPAWQGYDPFLASKTSSFASTGASVATLAMTLESCIRNNTPDSSDIIHRMERLKDFFLLSLWGNASDLSMFAGLSEDQVEKMQKEAAGQDKILCNHLDMLVEYMMHSQPSLPMPRIDFILDNAGFELFNDLLLADYLHQAGYTKKTVFHCKTMPWFVSDTMPKDFDWLLDALSNPDSFFKSSSPPKSSPLSSIQIEKIKSLASRWKEYIKNGDWIIQSHPFWCSFWAYHHLQSEAPELWKDLCNSSLLIFKGDLNYRKLVYDCKYESTTPFPKAIGTLFQTPESPPLVAFRTLKSDPCVGLDSGTEERLIGNGEMDWRWSGKYAVVQFCSFRMT